MHLLMLELALGVAVGLRWLAPQLISGRRKSWQTTLFLFIFPPLLLLTTAIAVLCMGDRGQMLGLPSGHFSYVLAVAIGLWGAGHAIVQLRQVGQAIAALRNYPTRLLHGIPVRWIPVEFPYCARVGFWRSEIALTEGLCELLDEEHLRAVLAHEQAHDRNRDTFWFLWLDSLRAMSAVLPHTEFLWQELLLLREMRADRQAAETTDPLLLAESLLQIAQRVCQPASFGAIAAVGVSFHAEESDRLSDRIDALLEPQEVWTEERGFYWLLLLLCSIPLITIPLHS